MICYGWHFQMINQELLNDLLWVYLAKKLNQIYCLKNFGYMGIFRMLNVKRICNEGQKFQIGVFVTIWKFLDFVLEANIETNGWIHRRDKN